MYAPLAIITNKEFANTFHVDFTLVRILYMFAAKGESLEQQNRPLISQKIHNFVVLL